MPAKTRNDLCILPSKFPVIDTFLFALCVLLLYFILLLRNIFLVVLRFITFFTPRIPFKTRPFCPYISPFCLISLSMSLYKLGLLAFLTSSLGLGSSASKQLHRYIDGVETLRWKAVEKWFEATGKGKGEGRELGYEDDSLVDA